MECYKGIHSSKRGFAARQCGVVNLKTLHGIYSAGPYVAPEGEESCAIRYTTPHPKRDIYVHF